MKKRTKNIPKAPRSYSYNQKGAMIVSRDWLGWYVLYKENLPIDELLDVAAKQIIEDGELGDQFKAVISRDGEATVTLITSDLPQG